MKTLLVLLTLTPLLLPARPLAAGELDTGGWSTTFSSTAKFRNPKFVSALYVPTAAEVDAELAVVGPGGVGPLIRERDECVMRLPALGKELGDDHPKTQRLRALVAGMDRRVVTLGGPALPGVLAPPTTMAATVAATAYADEVVQRLYFGIRDWSAYGNTDRERWPSGRVVQQSTGGHSTELTVLAPPRDGPYALVLYDLDNPPVSGPEFAVAGRVDYENVTGAGALELVATFTDGTRRSARTLAESGDAMRLTGSSSSRRFELRLANPQGRPPQHLTLGLVLPGTGRVGLRDVELLDRRPVPPPAAVPVAAVPTTGPAAVRRPIALAELPPAVAAEVRASLGRQLAGLLEVESGFRSEIAAQERQLGAGSRDVQTTRRRLGDVVAKIDDLRRQLETPLPAAPPAAAASPLPGPVVATLEWLNAHFTAAYLSLVAALLAFTLLARRLMRRGRGRSAIQAFFGLLVGLGFVQLFAAGVAYGMSKPPDAWAGLLGGAAVLIVVPWTTLGQVRRQFDKLELQKLRAMDVA